MGRFGFSTKAVGAAAIIVIVAFSGGFAYAAFNLGSFSTTYNQGLSSEAPNPPAGVTFTSALVQMASFTTPATTSQCKTTDASSRTSPDALTNGTTSFVCLNSVASTGYASSDSIESVILTWGSAASANTVFELTAFIGGATGTPVKAFVETPASITTNASAMVTFDLVSGGVTSVTSVSVLVSQCTSTSCP